MAEFWQGLSTESDVGVQADLFEQFYFDGSCDLKPVVTPEHDGFQCSDGGGYGGECGQIRTNQFIEREWNLREFTLDWRRAAASAAASSSSSRPPWPRTPTCRCGTPPTPTMAPSPAT